MRRMRTGLLVLTVAAASVVAGCGGDDEATVATPASSDPKVSFVSPMPDQELSGAVMAQIQIDGFTIAADKVGQPAVPGEGHVHFSMDGGKYDFPKYSGANGDLAVKLNVDGKYSPSVTPSITYNNLPAGEHTLKVSLADNLHTDTGASAETTFTVKAGPVSFVSPMSGGTVKGVINAKVALDGFIINADSVGKAPVEGEGHLHFQMDGGKYDLPKYSGPNGDLAVKLNVDGKYSPSVTPEITYTSLPKGEHTLKVFLVDNTHTDLGPMAETTFMVE